MRSFPEIPSTHAVSDLAGIRKLAVRSEVLIALGILQAKLSIITTVGSKEIDTNRTVPALSDGAAAEKLASLAKDNEVPAWNSMVQIRPQYGLQECPAPGKGEREQRKKISARNCHLHTRFQHTTY